jgi:Subtilase family/Peptidase inhibitor I9
LAGAGTIIPALMFSQSAAASAGVPTRVARAGHPAGGQAPLTAALAARLSANASDHVIVIMRSQPAAIRPGTRAAAMRSAAIARSQAPLLRELSAVHATHVKPYQLVNAVAATISRAEATRLRANPAVAAVVPDELVRGALPPAAAPAAPRPGNGRTGLVPHVIPGACLRHGRVLLEPEGLQTTHTASATPGARTARALGFTGAGVKVAWISDGLDPHDANFIRPDGRSVFDHAVGGDYRDFGGDGPGQITGGGEAFLDANAIAGQGIVVYDANHYGAQPDPGACRIRIQGTAPGAALAGFNAFGSFELTLDSNFLEALNYAVEVDHVNVISESFGSNPFPDTASLNVFKLFNDAAIAAGTTVVVASGDAGVTNTVGTPATDPKVISAGASTAFRFYAQTNYAAARYFATSGWLNDNISSLSSGGTDGFGGTVSLVTPGDLGWASCSTNIAIYTECTSFTGAAFPVEESGGTSASAPLTAGAAALVIQAYRSTHGGATPSPALVKQILMSTATDLGAPAAEQGAGLLNSYKAVLLAESVPTADGAPHAAGNTLLLSRTALSATGAAGGRRSWSVIVTNTGTRGQLVRARGRTFGPDEHVLTGAVTLKDGTSPQFTDFAGLPDNYATFHFRLRPGADRLSASIAYPGDPAKGNNQRVRLLLIDPRGRLAAHSLPQGVGNFSSAEVRQPVRGTWTAVIFGIAAADHGTNGTIRWRISTQRFAPFGSVWPRRFFLRPGESKPVHVTVTLPASPGDSAGSVVLTSSRGGFDTSVGRESNSIPVTLRSVIDLAHGGTFAGVLTGGNGRPSGGPNSLGQVAYYKFHLGPRHRSVQATVSLSNDAADSVGSYLVAPDGTAVGFGSNSINGVHGLSLTAYALDPRPGTWTLVIDFSGPVVGDEISQPFTGNVRVDAVRVRAAGLPDHAGTRLPAGKPVTVHVKITNTGAAPEAFFVDARLNRRTSLGLTSFTGSTFGLPLTTAIPIWLIPAQTSRLTAAAKATLPVEFDWGPLQGDPDLLAPPGSGDSAVGSFAPAGGTVQPGFWFSAPAEIGPYGAGGAKHGKVSVSMTAVTRAFDPAVAPATGDFWMQAVNPAAAFTPVVIGPGDTAVIPVTITPSGPSGTVVSGKLYVDDFIDSVPPFGQTTGDELAALPYTYTIK